MTNSTSTLFTMCSTTHYYTEHDEKRACLILGAFMEFILDCQDEGVDVNRIDITDFVKEKIDILEENK